MGKEYFADCCRLCYFFGQGGPLLVSTLLGVILGVSMCFNLSLVTLNGTGSLVYNGHLGMVRCGLWIPHPMVGCECLWS